MLKILIRIQRDVLWGGNCEKRKIAWARWEVVCMSREEGGLVIKNLDWFNVVLLAKWRWRVINKRG